MVATVFMLFLTVSEQKSKVKLISEFSKVFSITANSKTRKSRKDFSQFQD